MKREKGSTLLIILMIIPVFLSFLTGLFNSIYSDINMTEYNIQRVKSIYKAEAAVELALHEINKNPEITEEELEKISGSIDFPSDFKICEAEIQENGGEIINYELKSEGSS